MTKKTMLAALAAMTTAALASATGLIYTLISVREYESKNGVKILFGENENSMRNSSGSSQPTVEKAQASVANSAADNVKAPIEAKADASTTAATVAATAEPKSGPLKVLKVKYDGMTEIEVFLSERPDMENARRYVEVSPLRAGAAGLRYRASGDKPRLVVSGDFAHRTNVTLRIRKGLGIYGGASADPDGARSLADDFTYVFRRKDRKPAVMFANKGRYLPPAGSRAIAVESVNVTNLHAEIRRVEPRNIVQMLAREEEVYSQYNNYCWRSETEGADKEDTGELAGEATVRTYGCINAPNAKSTTPVEVSAEDGGPANGIYLVTVRDGGRPLRYRSYWDDRGDDNPNRYRVVCLTDLGLSARHSGGDVGVWVTSLKTGRPVAKCRIEAFSTANIKIAEGVSNDDGWCALKRVAKGEPFVVVAKTDCDMSFIAMRDSMKVDETGLCGPAGEYLGDGESSAFLWSERGIYRHDEKIFLHGILRNGKRTAPKPFPVEVLLLSPEDRVFSQKTLMPDKNGAIVCETFSVPADQPSGAWTFRAKTPGKDGKTLGERAVTIEEFAPPQIRVKVSIPTNATPQTFAFDVSGEHLFGSPARLMASEGAVVFEDVPFTPAGWEKFKFGNSDLGLAPCFRRLEKTTLDEFGKTRFTAPIGREAGLPKAAVRATGQGVVFEDGGRPATARASVTCHFYPFYIGANLPAWMKLPFDGCPEIAIACVAPDGRRIGEGKSLKAKIERIDTVNTYRKTSNGWHTWDTERVRTVVAEDIDITTLPDRDTTFSIPLREPGEFFLTITDPASKSSFGGMFYLCRDDEGGDCEVRASLSDPAKVSIQADKTFYRVGETPKLMVKSPFAGFVLLSVMRDRAMFTQVMEMTNATCLITLPPVAEAWAPSVDVAISVVQSATENARHLAVRAHGETVVAVRPIVNETTVRLKADVETGLAEGGSLVTVDVDARGEAATGTVAVVTLVDEGINLLTDEPTPDPVGCLSQTRRAEHPLYDLYGRILPILGNDLRKSGVKTGGGFGAELLGRVSPVPTRRFSPLAKWQSAVPLDGGTGRTSFRLPEFAGEVRITAVVYSDSATGAASIRRKVSPKLVMQPDAPRFAAPGDKFSVTLPLHNKSGAAAEIRWAIGEDGGTVQLADEASTNICFELVAPEAPGEMSIRFHATGCGENHEETIRLPVRPAVPWRETCATVRLAPGEKRTFTAGGGFARHAVSVFGSPIGELVPALEWLADYPHGCLEQTASRIFPLITAGGILNAVGSKAAADRKEMVAAGVKRVESMVRQNGFVMWPDCNYPPWDDEVSLYAAHFLVEAENAGQKVNPATKTQIMKFLKKWAMSTNTAVSAYACHTLALAGAPEKDRMLRLFDAAKSLPPLTRARLSRSFALSGDPARADALLATLHEPGSVKEAAFSILAILERNPEDERLPQLVGYLAAKRNLKTYSWGTTESNAHALLAIGAYYRHHTPKAGEPKVRFTAEGKPARELGKRQSATAAAKEANVENVGDGEAYVSCRTQALPPVECVTNESNGITISREFLKSDWLPADMDRLAVGDLLVVRLKIKSDAPRTISDLVVEDLFAGAFEPVHREMAPEGWRKGGGAKWIMRSDARDDRMLVFSKKFEMAENAEVEFYYPVRVVSAGDFILPGPSVEAMYAPTLRSCCAPTRIRVSR